jgi:16S rRNA A1518/A1519 N6-dimethyltransferase RsmA/KsgA/DIM1 with predicted DNA glycosylase/AP lyase activity
LPVADAEVERIFPKAAQKLGKVHWTTVEVARRAVELLVVAAGTRVLDVGSGTGKFCMIGALCSPGKFTGVERHRPFVELARELCKRYRIGNARFVHKDVLDVDWTAFDAFYLFNPYSESFPIAVERDTPIVTDSEQFQRCVEHTQAQLAAAPAGTRVVTYYGFGGDMPAGYEQRVVEEHGNGTLELWIKA